MNKKQRFELLWNILFVIFIMLLPIVDAPTRKPTALLFLRNTYVFVDFLVHGLCLLVVYFNYYFLAPKLYFKEKRLIYFAIVLLMFLVITEVPEFVEDYVYSSKVRTPERKRIHILIQIRHVFFIYFSLFFFSLYRLTEKVRKEAERLHALAQINFLKAQINPHFLFNTINSIYALIELNPQEAGASLIKMSNIMRYVMCSSDKVTVSLSTTIQYLKDYLDLQHARFGDTVIIDSHFDEPEDAYQIAALMLIPFVENAFKYGINPAQKSLVSIYLHCNGPELQLEVSNGNFSHLGNKQQSTGIGLQNTKERLELLYKDKYQLEIQEDEAFYKVNLHLLLG